MNKPLNITPVILCGGSGTRLWPLSRTGFPKQFLVLSGTTSLFQQAVSRLIGLGAPDITIGDTLVVTNEEHRFLVLDQLHKDRDTLSLAKSRAFYLPECGAISPTILHTKCIYINHVHC